METPYRITTTAQEHSVWQRKRPGHRSCYCCQFKTGQTKLFIYLPFSPACSRASLASKSAVSDEYQNWLSCYGNGKTSAIHETEPTVQNFRTTNIRLQSSIWTGEEQSKFTHPILTGHFLRQPCHWWLHGLFGIKLLQSLKGMRGKLRSFVVGFAGNWSHLQESRCIRQVRRPKWLSLTFSGILDNLPEWCSWNTTQFSQVVRWPEWPHKKSCQSCLKHIWTFMMTVVSAAGWSSPTPELLGMLDDITCGFTNKHFRNFVYVAHLTTTVAKWQRFCAWTPCNQTMPWAIIRDLTFLKRPNCHCVETNVTTPTRTK